MTTITTAHASDIPVRKLVVFLIVVLLGVLGYFVVVKPAVHQHTLDVRAERRAACVTVPAATEAAIVAGIEDTGGRLMRSLRAKPSDDGWWMVTANFAKADVPGGFTGEMATWRVRDDAGLVIEAVDKNARDYSTFPSAPDGVSVRDAGGFDSRWCAKNAALSP